MDDLEPILKAHPFLEGLAPEHVKVITGCAKNVRFKAGDYLLRTGDEEEALFLIRQGSVAIEMPRAGGEPVVIETLEPGDVLGVSCMTPTRANLDCRARETVLAFTLDNTCLRRKMNDDPRLGYALSMKLLERTYERLARARLQHLDVYR